MLFKKEITTLKDYLWLNKFTYRQFADKSGLEPGMILNFAKGKVIPRYITAKIIENATDGVLSAESLIRFSFETKLEKDIKLNEKK